MRWTTAGLCALSLIGMLGCPHAFGREGTIDRAMRKDIKERMRDRRCTQEELDFFCAEGQDLEECLERCG